MILSHFITKLDDLDIYSYEKSSKTKIFINGNWLGILTEPEKCKEYFMNGRLNGNISPYVSYHWNFIQILYLSIAMKEDVFVLYYVL